MLNFDEFLTILNTLLLNTLLFSIPMFFIYIYSGSARNSILEELSFLGSGGYPFCCHLFMVEIFSNLIVFRDEDPHMDSEYIFTLQTSTKGFSSCDGQRVQGSFFDWLKFSQTLFFF